MNQVTFCIEGKTISGNRQSRQRRKQRQGAYSYPVPGLKGFKNLVTQIATDAVFRAQYKIPEYCRLDASLYYSRKDRDNALKPCNDILQDIVFANDSRILDGATRRIKDWKGHERTIITVTEVLGAWYNYPNPKKSNVILTHDEWVAALLEPYDFSCLL